MGKGSRQLVNHEAVLSCLVLLFVGVMAMLLLQAVLPVVVLEQLLWVTL